MKNNNPIFLNLFQIKFPITAFVSILHRLSGAVLFIFIPLGLYVFEQLVSSKYTYELLIQRLDNHLAKVVIWLVVMGLVYHTVAGIRHLLMDFGQFESLTAARLTSLLVLGANILFGAYLGYLLWL